MAMWRVLAVALAGLQAQGAMSMYTDDAGKLDWHRQNLGRFGSAVFDGRGRLTVVGEVWRATALPKYFNTCTPSKADAE